MELTVAEKIRVLLRRKNMTLGDLADAMGQSRQNLSNKMRRNNFQESDIRAIAEALGCTVEVIFTFPDGEIV